MDNKITMTRLSAMLALATGKSGELCEAFLKELFLLIGDELEKGENVRIKGLGVFKLVDVEARKSVDVSTGAENEIPAHKRVIFVASKELATLVNSPFEAFEAVEISDDLPTDVFMESAPDHDEQEAQGGLNELVENLGEDVENPDEEVETFNDAIDDLDDSIENQDKLKEVLEHNEEVPVISFSHVVEDKLGKVEKPASEDDTELQEGLNPTSVCADEIDSNSIEKLEEDKEEEEEKNYRFAWGFLSGFAAAVVVIALGIGICVKFDLLPKGVAALLDRELSDDLAEVNSDDKSPGETNANGNLAVVSDRSSSDSTLTEAGGLSSEMDNTLNGNTANNNGNTDNDVTDSVPTRPSDEPVYDTVSTTRYLTTMAKEHYGNFNLWPIIYEENQTILGHPDRIKPGTKVVIPPLSKYKVNPDNPDDIKAMKQKGNSIYARYK